MRLLLVSVKPESQISLFLVFFFWREIDLPFPRRPLHQALVAMLICKSRFTENLKTQKPENRKTRIPEMKIITVTGYKGGVGKSTTAFHIAAYFSEKGKTILVDGDQNRTALKWAQRSGVDLGFTVADERQSMKMIPGSDYIIIDTPARPNSDDLKELAKGCDLLVLPTAPDVLSLEPMLDTARDLGTAKSRALITIVPPPPSREGEMMRDDLKEGGVPVFETMIRRTVGFPKAALAGVPIRDLTDVRARTAWEDYQALGREIEELIK